MFTPQELSPTISVIRGDGGPNAEIEFLLTDLDDVPVNLTGAAVWFTVKAANQLNLGDDSTAIIQILNTTHSDPLNGKTIFQLTTAHTTQTPGKYMYDVQVKAIDGSVMSIPIGEFLIKQDSTRTDVVPTP